MKWYSTKRIMEENAHYNFIIGERSNGKSTGVLLQGLKDYCDGKGQIAIVRRYDEDIRGSNGGAFFNAIVGKGLLEEVSNGKYDSVKYYRRAYYLGKSNRETNETQYEEMPFAYAFAVSRMERYKSTAYPFVYNIVFDECISRSGYLPDEFILFENMVSTICRERDDVKIWMIGNTVSYDCPYFHEMGLVGIQNMKPGDIKIYTYGQSDLKVAVEFSGGVDKKGKKSDVLFSFNNPRLNMITGKGKIWEIDIYPHLPYKYTKNDIVFTYFIEYNGIVMQCEIVKLSKPHCTFTYIHRKTTEIRDRDKAFIFSPSITPFPNHARRINRPIEKWQKQIWAYFLHDWVFYQDNELGEYVRNYLQWCNE